MALKFRISPGQASIFVVALLVGINVLDIKVEHASLVVRRSAPSCWSRPPGWPG